MAKREKLPEEVKSFVKDRQKGRCAACLEIGRHYHHVDPVALSGDNNTSNIVLLCKEHHSLWHLGDLETLLTILEYYYYVQRGSYPSDVDQLRDLLIEIKANKEKELSGKN